MKTLITNVLLNILISGFLHSSLN